MQASDRYIHSLHEQTWRERGESALQRSWQHASRVMPGAHSANKQIKHITWIEMAAPWAMRGGSPSLLLANRKELWVRRGQQESDCEGSIPDIMPDNKLHTTAVRVLLNNACWRKLASMARI